MWWLQIQRTEDFRSCVAEAVEWLVTRGWLERHRLQDGSEVFGYRKNRKGERDPLQRR